MSEELPPPLPQEDSLDLPTIRGLRMGDTVLGRFKLASCLGRGGMGEVWQAQDSTLGEDIALKLLPRLISADELAVEDLKNETRRGRQLSHPNIVRVFDFYQDEQNVGIAMELVQGDNLSRLRAQQPGQVFSVEALTPWVIQLLSALDYAHRSSSVVHRDLKPANLLIHAATRTLKVADFGIARCLADSLQRVTVSAQSRGTLCYMSPEQAMGRGANFIDDLYAVGATLYELLAGTPPFYQGDVYTQIQKVPPQPISQRLAENRVQTSPPPPAWEAAIMRCLSKQRADRPQSAGELAEMLGLHGVGSTAAYVIADSAAATTAPPHLAPPPLPSAAPSIPVAPPLPAHTGSISISTSAQLVSISAADAADAAGATQRSFVDLTRTQSHSTTSSPQSRAATLPEVQQQQQVQRPPRQILPYAALLLAAAACGVAGYMWQSQRANVSAPGTSPAAGPPSVPYGAEATIAFSPEAQLPPAGEVWKVPSAYFATLEAAISRAPAGTKIEVGEHKWTERIEITKDIHLVGKSQEHSIISVDGRKGAALGITSGTKVIVENMTLEHSSTEVVTGGAPLVHTETTQATFRKCRFIKAAGHGLEVATGSVIHAEDCSFEQNTHAGASVQTGAKLTLKNCNLSGNNVAVSVGGDQAKLFLEGGLLQGNATYGVEVISGAYAELTRAKIRESSQHGIFVQNPGSSILATEVSVEKCKRGTQIESGGSGTLKDCKHDGNEIGISLVDSGTATLSGGSASQNSTHGIAIEATGKIGSILISGMKVKSNASVGLLLSGAEVKADVAGNYFGPNGLIDILGKGQASGHFSKNTLHTGPDFKDFEGPVQWDADNVEGPTSGT